MTRNSLLLCTAMLFAAASPQTTLSEPLKGAIRLAQAAAPPADEKDKRPPGQRPAQGAPTPPGARPPAANAPPGRSPATAQPAPQQHPGGPPATAQTPPGQAPHVPGQAQTPPGAAPHVAPPATAQTPPGQAPRPGAPPATAQTPPGQAPHVPGQAQTPPGAAPQVAPPATAQTPPGQPPRPGAPAAQQGAPATAQTPLGQPARPGAAPGQQPAVANPNVRQPQFPAPAAGQPAAPGAVAAPGALPQRPGQSAPVAANAPVDPRSLPQHLDQLRNERQQVQVGNQTVIREANRTIIREGGRDIIRHDEADRFRFNAREVNVERHGNNTVTVVVRPDGARIITEVDENGRLLRRVRRDAAGREVILIDNGFEPRGPGLAGFVVDLPAPVIRIPRELYIREAARATADDIYLTLMAPPVDRLERRYGLDEILYSEPLRARMPRVDVDTINFATGSWEITADQSDRLAFVAQGIMRAVQRNPQEMFLVEGYTDAVGSDVDNLSLSDRRAESVAVMLTNQFGVPAENLTTQGYGKQFLKVPTDAPERANRRVAVRRITPLLGGGQS
jgi:outer membrane protein OmpA-like peptidoglycan-associated protein